MTSGAYSTGYVQDFEIETDESLFPWTESRIEQGLIIPDIFQTIPISVTTDRLASFFLAKPSIKTSYTRAFSKIDEFFSYVGGLIGTILGLMLFMTNFSLMAFELDLAQHFFKNDDN